MANAEVEIKRAEIKASVNRALDADDIKALRAADYCHVTAKGERAVQGCIRAVKKRKTDGFDDDLTRYIFVDSRLTDYAAAYSSGDGQYVCSQLIYEYDEAWRTIVSLLHVGDELTLEWVAANGNGYMKETALFKDELRLRVKRGDRRLLFNVEDSICEDNTARMIKHGTSLW